MAAAAQRRRRSSRSSATASWAARSWATRPISISCSSTTTMPTTPARASATRGSRSGSSPGSPAMTAAGQLYDTDLRLRPDGATGLCWCRSLAAFRRYQREHAWTWEHQALTRARFVAGDAAIGAAFEADARRDPAPAARPARACDRRRRHAPARCRGPPEPHRALRPEARRAAAWSTSSSPCSTWCWRTRTVIAALTRNAGNIALLGIAGDLGLSLRAIAPPRPTPTATTGGCSTRCG